MMRRRKKDQRDAKRPPRERATPGAAATRRRGRPDAPVPPELIVQPPAPAPEPLSSSPRRRGPGQDARAQGLDSRLRGNDGARDVVLVTGFDPFGGEQVNPSWEVCKRLPSTIGKLRVERCKVPCEFRRSIEAVAEAIDRLRPALVVCLGQAGGRSHLTVERVAINVDDARIEDNTGTRPIDEPISAHGPAAYFATLPIKAMAAAMRAAGVPAHVSNSAGTYVCNHLMYGVLHYLAGSGQAARAGFVHLPYAEEQVLAKPGMAAMSLETMVRGVQAAIAAAQEHARDIRVCEGMLD